MPVSTPEDMADAEGPNASLEFGDATKMADLNRQAGVLATGGQTQQPQAAPQQAGPSPQPAPAAPPPATPPVQPQAQPRDFSPGKYFSPPKVGKGPIANDWRHQIEQLASHPNAGPALMALHRLAQQTK